VSRKSVYKNLSDGFAEISTNDYLETDHRYVREIQRLKNESLLLKKDCLLVKKRLRAHEKTNACT
jgi:hypothetical protein